MPDNFTLPYVTLRRPWTGWVSYQSDPKKFAPNELAPPSINCLIDESGRAGQRLGYRTEPIDLTTANNPAMSFYLDEYDVTIFAVGTKLKYYDWTTQAVYDTGVTLTAGTVTRFDAFTGDIYLTNTTDGLRRLVFGRLNDASAVAGDSTVTIESDMAARLSVFSITSGNLIIQGTTEAFSSLVVSTGVVTLTGTLSQSYNNNAVLVVTSDISSGREKASKVFFWKERMGLIGSQQTTNADQPNAAEFFGKFATPTNLQDIIVFSAGSGGSVTEMVGKYGRITNVVPAKDYLYTFKTNQAYSAAAANIPITGATIGTTTPELRDENNGCLNEDCACVVGDNEIEYITSDNRIMRIKIATVSGAAVLFPDETFDEPLRVLLKDMDADQTGARSWYHRSKRRSIHQVKILGQWYWLIHSNTINENRGGWQPPQQVLFASSFFERKGVLYATDGTDDTVYSIGTTMDDDTVPIQCTIATADLLVGSVSMSTARLEGEISQAAIINAKSYVTTNKAGRRAGSAKIIDGSKFTYDVSHGIGIDIVGDSNVEVTRITTTDWAKEFDIFPSEANRCQLILTNTNGGYCSLFKYSINGQSVESFSDSL